MAIFKEPAYLLQGITSAKQLNISQESLTITTSSYTIDFSTRPNVLKVSLVGAPATVVLSVTGMAAGTTYFIEFLQGASATAITWPSNFIWPSVGSKVLSTTLGAIDTLSIVYDGTNAFVSLAKGYSAVNTFTGALAWLWGLNTYGQIGDNSTASRFSPVSVWGGHTFADVFPADGLTFFRKLNGEVWACGNNFYGSLGDLTTSTRYSPVSTVGSHSFIMVRGALTPVALKASGQAFGWGRNDYGQVGDNTRTNRSSPVSVVGGHSFIQIAHEQYGGSAYGLKDNGQVWTWGANSAGQLGDGTTSHRSSPVSVLGGHSFVEIAAFGSDYLSSHVLMRKEDGSVWSMGLNSSGQLGDGTTTNRASPVSVIGGHSFAKLGIAGATTSFAIKANGELWSWGNSTWGQLGNLTTTNVSSPISVVGGHSFIAVMGRVSRPSGEANYVVALRSDKTMWAWGANGSGQLGDGTSVDKSSPTSVLGNGTFQRLFLGVVPPSAIVYGSGWMWGYNNVGQIGDSSLINKSSPVSVLGGHSFLSIARGSGVRTLAWLRVDGSIWACGDNSSGQLGQNDVVNRSSPVSVLGSRSYVSATEGDDFIAALDANGQVWGCGLNSNGQLGDGTNVSKSSPVSVIGGHTFAEISGNYAQMMGRKPDGSVWCWGNNYSGTLGNGTPTGPVSSPVSVLGGHSFTHICCGWGSCHALKADGSCWSWGNNSHGQLGTNNNVSTSSPVSVVGSHSFIALTSGYNYSIYALKANGELWAWGYNNSGDLGDNTTTYRSSPVSVVGNHSFVEVLSIRNYNVAARKANGELWQWGNNAGGQLGDNTTVNRSSPVSVVGSKSFAKMFIVP